MKRLTIGSFPKGISVSRCKNEESALLAVLIVLYDAFILNSFDKKSSTCEIFGERTYVIALQ